MATAPSQRSLDKQAAADLLVQPQNPTKLELMQASSFSHIVSLQSEDVRQSILAELHADKPANGYTADAAAQIAENVSKHRTDEWPFLRTYNENVGHMVARTELSEQSTRLTEILKENPIDSFEKRSPSLMDYGQTLLAVELNLRPNISETEKLPSLLRGIETAAHHNAYDQYHYNFDYTKEPAANYTDIALDAKERTKPFIEAVFNDPVIMRDINSEKKRYFDMNTGPDGLLKDASVAAAIFPDEASPHAQQVLLSSINALPYSAQQEAAESLMLSKDFGMDFSLESAKDSLTNLMALRDKTYPNKVADDLSQRELFTEAFDMSLAKNPAPVNQSPEPLDSHPSAHDNAFEEANEVALAHAPAADSPDTAYLLSAIDRDLKNAYANNMLAGLNKDYAELYQSTKDGTSNPELITNKGVDFLDNANAFGSVVNAIADKSRGDADYQQELKDTMKEVSAYVDDTAHIIGYVNHDTGNEADALHRGRTAMQGMDKHREVLDSTIASFNEVAPAVVNENTDKAPAPRR